ncbi:hypothetical protein C0J52_16832 [Blattella germanica]|nr:hypothetical protein C0J52_16832 [Blattella germanica]
MVKPRPCTKYRPCAKPLTDQEISELVNDSDSDGFELEDDFQEDEVIAPGSSNSAPETVSQRRCRVCAENQKLARTQFSTPPSTARSVT